MRRPAQLVTFTALCLGCFLTSLTAQAQMTRRDANRLGVDVLTLQGGGELRGMILQRAPDGTIQMAVRRQWLAAEQPKLLQSLAHNDVDARLKVYEQLIDRLDNWLADLDAAQMSPESPEPTANSGANEEREELLRVLQAERTIYQEYVDDPLKLPAGEGTPAARRAAYQQLIRRLDQWTSELQPRQELAADEDQQRNRDELVRILHTERQTYQQLLDNPAAAAGEPESEFVRVTLNRADVRLISAQPPARRQLALAAWQHDVPDVETLSVPELQSQLTEKGADWKSVSAEPDTLLDEATPQDDRQWAARRAIYEYQFLKRLDFQGTGNVIVQTGAGAPPPNLAEILQGTLDQQMSSALGDLLEEPIFTGLDFGGLGKSKPANSWLAKVTRTADADGLRGVRVTRMTPDLQRRQTVVEDRFLAKMSDGTWETIWLAQETKSAREADQNDLDRIRQDPQLKEVLGLVEGLGLGNSGQLDLALQFGAATMNAQQATDDQFYEFRDRYTKRLDGPPLSWK